ncbi:MAG: hypothetical protein WCY19_06710 [Candidatus Gastranaerophilaceae bacterium]
MLTINPIGNNNRYYPKTKIQNRFFQSPLLKTGMDSVSFGAANPKKIIFEILPNLDIAIKKSLTGIYKEVHGGSEFLVKLIEGKKVEETLADDFGNKIICNYDKNGKLIKKVSTFAGQFTETIKFKFGKTSYIKLQYSDKSVEESHFTNGKITSLLLTDGKGKVLGRRELLYYPNNSLKEIITRVENDCAVSTLRYDEAGNVTEAEDVINNAYFDRRVFYVGRKKNQVGSSRTKVFPFGLDTKTDCYAGGGVKSFSASFDGLSYNEEYYPNTTLKSFSKDYKGMFYELYLDEAGNCQGGIFKTKDHQIFKLKFDEEGIYIADDKEDDAIVDSLNKWLESTFSINKFILKYKSESPQLEPDPIEIISKSFKPQPAVENVKDKQLARYLVETATLKPPKDSELFSTNLT